MSSFDITIATDEVVAAAQALDAIDGAAINALLTRVVTEQAGKFDTRLRRASNGCTIPLMFNASLRLSLALVISACAFSRMDVAVTSAAIGIKCARGWPIWVVPMCSP